MTTYINISSSNISGKCDLKCVYNFNYPNTNVVASNDGVAISLKFDATNDPAVTYNGNKYNPATASIVSPSINIFNGDTVPAEIIITHLPTLGGPPLMVSVPIISSSESSPATSYISEIIQNVSTNAPKVGSSTTINNSDFTLKSIIPKKPFYNYTLNESNTNMIVYDVEYAIPLSSYTLSTLSSIIKPFPYSNQFNTSSQLFHNSSGPNSNSSNSEGIYIKCNPTGSSSETTDVDYLKNPVTIGENFNNLDLQSFESFLISTLLIIIIFVFFFCVFYGIEFLSEYLTSLLKISTKISK